MNFKKEKFCSNTDVQIQDQSCVFTYSWSNINTLDTPDADLENMVKCFWLWENDSAVNESLQCQRKISTLISEQWTWDIFDTLHQNYDKGSYFHSSNNTFNSRARRTSLPSIKDNLIKILYFINIGIFIYLNHSNKSARGLFNGVSRRRSRYIGVLRNRSKWQVLLNEGKVKKYIGTYPTEKEAAIVNDFYSIGINGLAAKTNFSYNSSQIAWMITSYFSNNMQFDPSIFASQIY